MSRCDVSSIVAASVRDAYLVYADFCNRIALHHGISGVAPCGASSDFGGGCSTFGPSLEFGRRSGVDGGVSGVSDSCFYCRRYGVGDGGNKAVPLLPAQTDGELHGGCASGSDTGESFVEAAAGDGRAGGDGSRVSDNAGVSSSSFRGKNWERNQEWKRQKREKKKRRSLGRSRAFFCGDRGAERRDDVTGFWASCKPETRQELIESKARMHVAENIRKAREAEERVAYYDSAQAIVDKVTKLVRKASEIAERSKDDRVMGWARTVMSSGAESLAKSAPDSVVSFESFVSRDDLETATASVRELEQERDSLKLRVAELESSNRQYKKMEGLRSAMSFSKKPMNRVEFVASQCGALTDAEIRDCRIQHKRLCVADDFLKGNFSMTSNQRSAIEQCLR